MLLDQFLYFFKKISIKNFYFNDLKNKKYILQLAIILNKM